MTPSVSEVEKSFFTGAFSPAAAKIGGAADSRIKADKQKIIVDWDCYLDQTTNEKISYSNLINQTSTLHNVIKEKFESIPQDVSIVVSLGQSSWSILMKFGTATLTVKI